MFFYPDDSEIRETCILVSSFKHFCVVRIEKQIRSLFFWRSYGSTILFRDLLTFSGGLLRTRANRRKQVLKLTDLSKLEKNLLRFLNIQMKVHKFLYNHNAILKVNVNRSYVTKGLLVPVDRVVKLHGFDIFFMILYFIMKQIFFSHSSKPAIFLSFCSYEQPIQVQNFHKEFLFLNSEDTNFFIFFFYIFFSIGFKFENTKYSPMKTNCK